ncbi:hypothetical protein ACIQ9R_37420 [Streptomyces sp. NPDC094447]|uniref:hypothetical protein n=1 Tax=Streptomyces sp. NPDC094447 TaxID=3366062 RepID=UPI00381BD970
MTAHGTLSCGKYRKCPRPECREAARAYRRLTYRKQGYGTWQPLVDAEPARQHLLALNAAGFSYQVIAEHLGRYTAAVTGIVYELSPNKQRKRRIRPEFEAAILALTPESMTPGMLPAAGSVRRVRALNAMGWPTRVIADHMGTVPARIRSVTAQRLVTRATAQGISNCYQALHRLNPLEHGIAPGTVLKLTRMAARKGWRDPLWWEDMGHIDDPEFDPASVEQELGRNEEAAVRRGEIEHLMSYGFDHENIAARMNMHPTTVRNIMNELRTGKRRDRGAAA